MVSAPHYDPGRRVVPGAPAERADPGKEETANTGSHQFVSLERARITSIIRPSIQV